MLPPPTNAAAHPDAPLPRQIRASIVLVALLQGGLLYLAALGEQHGVRPFTELGMRICWYTLVMTVPSMVLLSLQQLRDRRLWQHIAGSTLVLAALAGWAAWSATGAPGLRTAAVLWPFGFTVTAGWFVALPWLQSRQQHGHWRADYRDLFEHAWQNALTLALALLFVWVCWMVLWLWASLFALVKIMVFRELFREQAFIYLATGIMTGLGILIGRTQHRAVQVMRQILFALCTGLLPLLAGIALLFVLVLPFTGLQALWQTRSAAAILLSLVFGLVLFTNAVYRDGDVQPPYPRWLRRVVEAGLLSLPAHAGLAAYALALRIGQHGWTGERFCAAVLASLALAYALAYAFAVLRPRADRWLPHLASGNLLLSWVVIGLAILINSPLLDPYRITVQSQMQRLATGTPESEKTNLQFLRFDNGRRGYLAVQSLRDDPAFAGDAARQQALGRLLARTERWDRDEQAQPPASNELTDLAQLRKQVVVAAGKAAPPADWWTYLLTSTPRLQDRGQCTQRDSDCVVSSDDLDGDGQPDVLLCNVKGEYAIDCVLYARNAAGWYQAGTIRHHSGGGNAQERLRQALRNGQLQTRPTRWPDLILPEGTRIDITPSADGINPPPRP
ncbi:DUF4153 domain-containing protein [Xanthomonas cucurbitae]|uniref:DUF4153 domain-containing protein n=1 Tax=Xanthomonas cucurbitae TaxID=56453 RepID=A0A2S7DF75_9XANT|nr:DUF4153 domain-containing protein [Xanthomonas cucurbitae]PPU72404.1 DUF4153 domain-containing protein [Xanthomonas cucurbitae]WDM66519.1 DUF4153 domain-containing protein [Xanthomonas cucurbitae]WDM70398.1 DUF4153 domain-containing protein [Xanthomonas cucurbitae]WDM80281.1 DUF4153 domain-containing protein [Xanthomonas cucurbitae]WDM83972.1 DUF4153 domain-containing protein [Xanthomonas cucurbitae]